MQRNRKQPTRRSATTAVQKLSIDDVTRLTNGSARALSVTETSKQRKASAWASPDPSSEKTSQKQQQQQQQQNETVNGNSNSNGNGNGNGNSNGNGNANGNGNQKSRLSYTITSFLNSNVINKRELPAETRAFYHGWTVDKIPPANTGVVRVFISSTFTDMQIERNALMIHVYPTLKSFCRNEYGLEFQVVDMRWGVTEEASDNHRGPLSCLREIGECQQRSTGPNFLIFLGQRYGWVPLPRTINKLEFELILAHLSSSYEFSEDVKLLNEWYREDSNNVPSYYLLQRISKILPSYFDVNKNAMQDARNEWLEKSTRMQKAIQTAANALLQNGSISADEHKSFMISVTHMEAQSGLLSVEDASQHCLAYVRTLDGLNKHDIWAIGPYVDTHGMRVDTRFQGSLNEMRESILRVLPPRNKKEFAVPFAEYVKMKPYDPQPGSYLRELIDDVTSKLMTLVRNAAAAQDRGSDRLQDEVLRHLRLSRDQSKNFVGREDIIKAVMSYIFNETKRKVFVINGIAGCGRTSTIAKLHISILEKLSGDNGKTSELDHTHIIVRYLGTTSDSSTLTSALQSICSQILQSGLVKIEASAAIPTKMTEVCDLFLKLIASVPASEQLIILLDALENLDHEQSCMISLQWIPRTLPANVKLVLTTSSDPVAVERQSSAFRRYLQRRVDLAENAVTLGALNQSDAQDLLKILMGQSHRCLTDAQSTIVKSCLASGAVPLYVNLLHKVVSDWRSYDHDLNKPPRTIAGCINELLNRLEKVYGITFVTRALSYITAANAGLSEMELEDILSLDDDVLNEIYEWHIPPTRRIPSTILTRLVYDLSGYLMEHCSGTTNVLRWYHTVIHEAVRERYLKNLKTKREVHSLVADYFLGTWAGKMKPFRYSSTQLSRFRLDDREYESDRLVSVQPFIFDSKENRGPLRFNSRKITELTHNLVRAGRLEDVLRECFFNFDYLYSRMVTSSVESLVDDIDDYPNFRNNPDLLVLLSSLKLSASMLNANPTMLGSHLLSRLLPYYHESPYLHQLLAKCDVEGVKQCALVPVHHCMQTPGGPLQNSFEGPRVSSYGIFVTEDGEYLVSGSNKLFLWCIEAGTMDQKLKHNISGVIQTLRSTPDRRIFAGFTSSNQVFVCVVSTLDVTELDCVQQSLAPFISTGDRIQDIEVTNNDLFVWTGRAYCRYSLLTDTLCKTVNLSTEFATGENRIVQVRDAVSGHDVSGVNEIVVIGHKSNETVFSVLDVANASIQLRFKCFTICHFNASVTKVFCCESANNFHLQIRPFGIGMTRTLRNPDAICGLTLSANEQYVVATVQHGFHFWDTKESLADPHVLLLPTTTDMQNFPQPIHATRQSLVVFSKNYTYLACAIKRYIVVYSLSKQSIVTTLDSHYDRIISLTSNPQSDTFVSSSTDLSIKVWDFTFITAQQHKLTRLSRGVDSLYVNSSGFAIAVTKAEASMWNTNSGRLVKTIAELGRGSFLQAAVSHDAVYLITLQERAIIVWNVASWTTKWMLECEANTVVGFRLLLSSRFLIYKSTSKYADDRNENPRVPASSALAEMSINTAKQLKYTVECTALERYECIFSYQYEHTSKYGFLEPCLTDDESFLCVLSESKNQGTMGEEELCVNSAVTGKHAYNLALRYASKKEIRMLCRVNGAPKLIGVVDSDKATIINIISKTILHAVPYWSTGLSSADGRFGVSLSNARGLQTVDLKTGKPLITLIERNSSTCALKMLVQLMYRDQYLLFYSSETRDVRVFRLKDGVMIAQVMVGATVTCIEVFEQRVVIGMQDGSVVVLLLADSERPEMLDAIGKLPSRQPRSRQLGMSVATAFAVKKLVSLKRLSRLSVVQKRSDTVQT